MPSEFPPARLFLDDVEEIVHVLTELVQTRAQQNIKITVALSSGQQECDSVQDLPKILRMSESVEIEVYADTFAYTNLRLHPWLLAIWRSTGFTKESAWDAYHKLQPIFERRKLRLNAIFHALPAWSFALFSVAGLLIVEVTAKLGSVAMLSVLILLVGLVVSVARHSVVLPRNSWDPAPPWTYAKERLIPVLLGAALGIFGTILGIYLKHKIWP